MRRVQVDERVPSGLDLWGAPKGRVSRRFAGSLIALLVLTTMGPGCISTDPNAPQPLEPLPLESRAVVRILPMSNEASSAEVAVVTSASTELLRALFERSRRFSLEWEGGPRADWSIETWIHSFRDEDSSESLVYDSAQTANPRRLAVVEVAWRQLDGAGRTLAEGIAIGTDERIGARSLVLPTAGQLESGAYWDAPFGRATRSALVQIVRTVSGAG